MIPNTSAISRPARLSLSETTNGKRVAAFVVLIGFAALIGKMIASEQWLYVGVLGVIIVALQWPLEAALGIYAFLIPFESLMAYGHGQNATTINWLVGAASGMALLAKGVATKRLSWPGRPALWWSLFLAWAVLSTLWALQPAAAMHLLPTVVSVALLYLVAVSWKITKREFKVLTAWMVLGGCIAAGFTAYEFTQGITWSSFLGSSGRASLVVGGREVNPNSLATDLLLPFSFAVSLFFSARRWPQALLGIGATGIIASAVYLTMSRTSLLGLAVVICVYLVRVRLQRRTLAIASILVLVALAMPAAFFSRVSESLADRGSGRLDIWSVGLVMVKHYGVTGVGLANFQVAYTNFAGHASRFFGYGRGAHNMYLEVAVEFGVVGMILLLAALVSNLRVLWQAQTAHERRPMYLVAVEASCWAAIVAQFFAGETFAKSLWFTWTVCLMAAKLAQQEKEAAPGETTSYSPIAAMRSAGTATANSTYRFSCRDYC